MGRRRATVRVAWESPLQAKTTAERSSPTRRCRTSCRTSGKAKRSGRSQSGRRPLLDPFGSEDMSRKSCAGALLGPLSTSRVTSGHAGLAVRATCRPSATQPEMHPWASPVQLLCGRSCPPQRCAGCTSRALVRGQVASAFAPRGAPPRCTRLQHAAAHSWPHLQFAALRAATLVHSCPHLGCAAHVLRALSRHECALAPPWALCVSARGVQVTSNINDLFPKFTIQGSLTRACLSTIQNASYPGTRQTSVWCHFMAKIRVDFAF